MTFSDTEMKDLGRGTWNNTHNITLLIRTLKYVSDILQTEDAFTVDEYKHNTHTHTHKDILFSQNDLIVNGDIVKLLIYARFL